MSYTDKRHDPSRQIAAPTGTELSCKSWLTEAPLRMLMNNLHPDVAERPEDLVVYGGIGRAAPVGDKMTDASLEARELQDALIAEVMDADVLVIGLPIYNFGLPSTLKAWFDYVLRAGTTFQYTEQGPEGLVKNTKAIVAQSRAGKYDDDAGVIFGMPHLKGLLGFMGVTDVEVVTAEGMAFGPEAAASAIADAKAAIAKLA